MERDPFLDRLTGQWDLRGEMGGTPLHQSVQAQWVLLDRFVHMNFRELDNEPYEATYLVGRDEAGTYILVLADSTGVYADPAAVVGLGRRDGDAVDFAFAYEDGTRPFVNRFEWHPSDGSWTHLLTGTDADGRPRPFATKRLVRIDEEPAR